MDVWFVMLQIFFERKDYDQNILVGYYLESEFFDSFVYKSKINEFLLKLINVKGKNRVIYRICL